MDEQCKLKLKKQFHRHHHTGELPVLENQVPVYISSGRSTSVIPGNVAGQQGNDHTKIRHQPDCLNVTEVS